LNSEFKKGIIPDRFLQGSFKTPLFQVQMVSIEEYTWRQI